MDIEETDKGIKISVPIITNEELERLDYTIESNLGNIVHQISETVSRDRDIIILKKVIEKQQKELDKKDKIINAMAEEYSLEANTDVLDICACCNHNNEDCYGDYCKEALINYFTKKVEG